MTINSYVTDDYNNIIGTSNNPSFDEYINCRKAVAYIKDGDLYQVCDISDHYRGFQELNEIVTDRYNTLKIGVDRSMFFINGETDDIKNIITVYELINYLINNCKSLSEITISIIYDGINNTSIKRDSNGNLTNVEEVLKNFEEVIKNVELDQILDSLTVRQQEKEKKGFFSSLRR